MINYLFRQNSVKEVWANCLKGCVQIIEAHHFLSGKSFSEQELCNLLRQIASALHHLHSSNLVHLDVKPENIYVTPAEQYKIGDFGMICTADEKSFEEGDSRYMPKDLFCEFPELTKADIFSLGCSVYELVSWFFLKS